MSKISKFAQAIGAQEYQAEKLIYGVAAPMDYNQIAVVCKYNGRAEEIIGWFAWCYGKSVSGWVIDNYMCMVSFVDSTVIFWVDPNCKARGYRFNKMICEKDVGKSVFNSVILLMYNGDVDDIV